MTTYEYDDEVYQLSPSVRYQDAEGGRWTFAGEFDGPVPYLSRVDCPPDDPRRQQRTLPDVVENFGPLALVQ